MRSTRELDPDAGFVALVTASLLATGLIMFSPELLTTNWTTALLRQELPSGFGSSSKFDAAMAFTGPKEGGCQNWVKDNGNWHKGRRGFTCFGIVPYTAEVAVRDGVMTLPPGVDVLARLS